MIPPPAPIPPPSDVGEQTDADLKARKATRRRPRTRRGRSPALPAGSALLRYVGRPLLLVAARRSARSSAPSRCAGAGGAGRHRLGPLRRGLARARRPRPRPRAAGAARRRHPARAVAGDRSARRGRASLPGAPTARLRARRARREVDRRGELLGARSTRARGPSSAGGRRRRRRLRGGREPARPSAAGPLRRSLIGVHGADPTRLACRPNVGRVSWCLAAARTTSRLAPRAGRACAREEVPRSRRTRSTGPAPRDAGGSRADGRRT